EPHGVPHRSRGRLPVARGSATCPRDGWQGRARAAHGGRARAAPRAPRREPGTRPLRALARREGDVRDEGPRHGQRGAQHAGEAASAGRDPDRLAVRFRVSLRRVEHRRHLRKYAEGELPPDRSFYFRGSEGALNLRAANLLRFCELADGVDEATWAHHLRHGDYSAWVRDMIKDPELAEEIAGIERETLPPAESRRRALEAIRRRHA